LKVSAIIPACENTPQLRTLIDKLFQQTCPPTEIIILDSSPEHTLQVCKGPVTKVIPIPPEDFDHGGTRRIGAEKAQGDVLLYMTQDAMPADRTLIEHLTRPLKEKETAAAYARQLPTGQANPIDAFARGFNYPDAPIKKDLSMVPKLGIKTFFCSNVCAAYRRKEYEEAGGFPPRIIANEDMILTAKLLYKGYKVAYVPEARVFHSHNYSFIQQLRRYFDIGTSIKDFHDLFLRVPQNREGWKFVAHLARALIREGRPLWLLQGIFDVVARYAGFRLGLHYKIVPRKLRPFCSSYPRYWR